MKPHEIEEEKRKAKAEVQAKRQKKKKLKWAGTTSPPTRTPPVPPLPPKVSRGEAVTMTNPPAVGRAEPSRQHAPEATRDYHSANVRALDGGFDSTPLHDDFEDDSSP